MMRYALLLVLFIAGCSSPPPRTIPVSYSTPAMLLTSLKGAADRSMNEYYARLRTATDCEELPNICRLLAAREIAAEEMSFFFHTMKDRYGSAGARAAQQMIAGAFGDQYDALQYASVNAGSGEIAFLRIGEDIYTLRESVVGWRIVQAPTLKHDPVVTAEAIELLAARVESVRVGIAAGKYTSIDQVLGAMERVFTPGG